MMKMKTTLSVLTIAAALTMLTTACSNDDNLLPEQTAQQVRTVKVTIPATMGEGTRSLNFSETTVTSRFQTSDEIYVYNKTQEKMLDGCLHPTNINEDGKKCELTGTISGSFSENDVLTLLYNPNGEQTDEIFMDYSNQTGAMANVPDGAVAEVTLTGTELGSITTAPAMFVNAQALFRQRLTFKNADNETVHPTITLLRVRSKNNKLIKFYRPLEAASSMDRIDSGGITFENPTIDDNGDIYLALRFKSSSDDALILTAYDSDGNVYELEKNAPADGFQNGRYYHGAMTLSYIRNLNNFVVTGTSATPNSFNSYWIDEDNFNITVSGTTGDYTFYLRSDGKMTLNEVTATISGTDFISGASGKTITLEINGTNTISCTNQFCIGVSNLILCGCGTLTVSVNQYRPDFCGIVVNSGAANPSTVAAEGYKVTRTEVSATSPYSYAWTYTVEPIN